MAKLLPRDYFKIHFIEEEEEDSAEVFAHDLMTMPDLYDNTDTLMKAFREMDSTIPDTTAEKALVQSIEDPNELIRMLRKGQRIDVQMLIIHKLLEREEEVMPEIQRIIQRSFVDSMIESAYIMFVKCKTNYSDWIVANYKNIRSTYAQALMCLVLGFRADASVVPFLMRQVDYLEEEYCEETYCHGPILALQELCDRFEHA